MKLNKLSLFSWLNEQTNLKRHTNTISYCFTLFICGGPCHLSSFKHCCVDLLFLWEQLVYSVIEKINICELVLPPWIICHFFSEMKFCPFNVIWETQTEANSCSFANLPTGTCTLQRDNVIKTKQILSTSSSAALAMLAICYYITFYILYYLLFVQWMSAASLSCCWDWKPAAAKHTRGIWSSLQHRVGYCFTHSVGPQVSLLEASMVAQVIWPGLDPLEVWPWHLPGFSGSDSRTTTFQQTSGLHELQRTTRWDREQTDRCWVKSLPSVPRRLDNPFPEGCKNSEKMLLCILCPPGGWRRG